MFEFITANKKPGAPPEKIGRDCFLYYFNLVDINFKTCHNCDIKHHRQTKWNLSAFTLAEVLITLGIIGVVAALTIPNMIVNYQKKVLPVRLQKFYSTFTNALQMSQAENGDITSWDFAKQSDGSLDAYQSNDKFYNNYLLKYMKGVEQCAPKDNKCNYEIDPDVNAEKGRLYTRLIFTDGSCFGILTGWSSSTMAQVHGWFDYNCNGKPNKAGKDEFSFYMRIATNPATNTPFQYTNFYNNGSRLSDMDREEVKELCKTEPQNCGALIQYDGWQIKDDYPWRK